MKKLTLTLIAVIFLSACVEEVYIATNDNKTYVGDSNCAGFTPYPYFKSAAQILGYLEDCEIRRTLAEVDQLPDVDLVFLALGINGPGTREQYTDNLNRLIGETAAVVVCVLPVSLDTSKSEMQREVMQEVCIEWIDPYDAPVNIAGWVNGVYDGVHYTDQSSQDNLALLMDAKAKELGL